MPTSRDVFETILAEVTGKPREEVAKLAESFPITGKIDEQISQEEYDRLLGAMRKEKQGILNWLIEGEKRQRGLMAKRN